VTDEERKARLYHHLYETCEGIAEQSERIVRLEELAVTLYRALEGLCTRGRLQCDRCPLLGEGMPCELARAGSTLEEMGVV
jgi:hypothetical protein